MRLMTASVCFVILVLAVIQGCQYINKPDSEDNDGDDIPEWKGTGSTSVSFREYSVHNTSSYTVYGEMNKTLYACIKDSATFNQYFSYTPQTWDSTFISPALFSYQLGILVSDQWVNKRAAYFVEGVYILGKKMYINYQKDIYPINNVSAVHNSFLFIVVNKNSADSIFVIENKVEISKIAVGFH